MSRNFVDVALCIVAAGAVTAAIRADWLLGGYFIILFVCFALGAMNHD